MLAQRPDLIPHGKSLLDTPYVPDHFHPGMFIPEEGSNVLCLGSQITISGKPPDSIPKDQVFQRSLGTGRKNWRFDGNVLKYL